MCQCYCFCTSYHLIGLDYCWQCLYWCMPEELVNLLDTGLPFVV